MTEEKAKLEKAKSQTRKKYKSLIYAIKHGKKGFKIIYNRVVRRTSCGYCAAYDAHGVCSHYMALMCTCPAAIECYDTVCDWNNLYRRLFGGVSYKGSQKEWKKDALRICKEALERNEGVKVYYPTKKIEHAT